MANYFVGVLLDASKNRDNKMEWTEKNGKVYYRTGAFHSKWDFHKAKEVPCNVMAWLRNVDQARQQMRDAGLAAPGVFRSKTSKNIHK